MLEDLKGQVAVVTGGARGLGFSMAAALARLGVRVALLDMLAGVTDSAVTLAVAGVKTLGLTVDVTGEEALAAAFAEVSRELGSPTILINAAGITTWEDSLEGSKASWSKVIEVNLTGTYPRRTRSWPSSGGLIPAGRDQRARGPGRPGRPALLVGLQLPDGAIGRDRRRLQRHLGRRPPGAGAQRSGSQRSRTRSR